MLFKKLKYKMICFLEAMMVTWQREVFVLLKNRLEVLSYAI